MSDLSSSIDLESKTTRAAVDKKAGLMKSDLAKSDTNEAVLDAAGLIKTFKDGNRTLTVLDDIGLHVQAGERVAIVGASGSGKSTLLHILAGLDNADAGYVKLAGKALSTLGHSKRGKLRNQYMGFVYQFHHLMPELTALDNVALPLRIGRVPKAKAQQMAEVWLKKVGLGHRMDHLPAQLSGGERQRAAVARALVTEPKIVLADEPTGSLDKANAEGIADLINSLNSTHGTAFLIATHDHSIADQMDRKIVLDSGRIAG